MQRVLNRLPGSQTHGTALTERVLYSFSDLLASILAVDLQDVLGSGPAVQLVDVLSDDRDLATLFAQALLALGYGHVGRVGVFGEHDLTAVVVKLPDTRRIPGEGHWGGEFLSERKSEEKGI